MASEIKLWQLHEGKLQDVNDSFAAEHLEKDLARYPAPVLWL